MNTENVQRIFRNVPGLFLIIRPDERFTIVAASDEYLRATHTEPGIFGRPLFEVFPDNPEAPEANAVNNLRASLGRVLANRAPDRMPEQRYDVQLPPGRGGGFEERYWSVVNAPVLGDAGEVDYIVHRVEDATAKAKRDAIGILESITEGFFTLDRQWRFDYVNQAADRIMGREPGSLTGKILWTEYPAWRAPSSSAATTARCSSARRRHSPPTIPTWRAGTP